MLCLSQGHLTTILLQCIILWVGLSETTVSVKLISGSGPGKMALWRTPVPFVGVMQLMLVLLQIKRSDTTLHLSYFTALEVFILG